MILRSLLFLLLISSSRFAHAQNQAALEKKTPNPHAYLNKTITPDPKATSLDDFVLDLSRQSGKSIFLDTTDLIGELSPPQVKPGRFTDLLRPVAIEHKLSYEFEPHGITLRKIPDIQSMTVERLGAGVRLNNAKWDEQAVTTEMGRLFAGPYKWGRLRETLSFEIAMSDLSPAMQQAVLAKAQQHLLRQIPNGLPLASVWFNDDAWRRANLGVEKQKPDVIWLGLGMDGHSQARTLVARD